MAGKTEFYGGFSMQKLPTQTLNVLARALANPTEILLSM